MLKSATDYLRKLGQSVLRNPGLHGTYVEINAKIVTEEKPKKHNFSQKQMQQLTTLGFNWANKKNSNKLHTLQQPL